ncbi:MAG: 5-formyltetrahydrofolate cyclo-ligase [Isosphaeraceae bacterium]
MSLNLEKRLLRESICQQFVADFPAIQRTEATGKIAENLRKLLADSRFPAGTALFAYWPLLAEEPDFRPILHDWLGHGMRLGLPGMVWSPRSLVFRQVKSIAADLVADSKGIPGPRAGLPELMPEEAGMVIVPGLAFSRAGHRLGRGAGFYDRFLAKVGPAVPLWAPAFDIQVVPRLPVAEHDMKIHGLILPDGLWDCQSESWVATSADG